MRGPFVRPGDGRTPKKSFFLRKQFQFCSCLLLQVGIHGSFGLCSDGHWQSWPPSGGLRFIGVDDDGGLGPMKILNDPFAAQQRVIYDISRIIKLHCSS